MAALVHVRRLQQLNKLNRAVAEKPGGSRKAYRVGDVLVVAKEDRAEAEEDVDRAGVAQGGRS